MSRRLHRGTTETPTAVGAKLGTSTIDGLTAVERPDGQIELVDRGSTPDPTRSEAGRTSQRSRDRSRPEQLEIRVHDVLVHRSPPAVARSLRYLLAGESLPRRIAFTSAIHGEGVTTISRAVAALMAYDWWETICWVDLNWWKVDPARHEAGLFPVTIADVVAGDAAVSDLAVPSSIVGLSMVASGDVPVATRARLPKSDELASVVHDLAQSFDRLIFDVPPVLASSDAVTLSAMSEGYFLAVRQKSASSVQVRAALDTLSATPCLGTVLNDARSRVPRWLRTSNEVWALGT